MPLDIEIHPAFIYCLQMKKYAILVCKGQNKLPKLERQLTSWFIQCNNNFYSMQALIFSPNLSNDQLLPENLALNASPKACSILNHSIQSLKVESANPAQSKYLSPLQKEQARSKKKPGELSHQLRYEVYEYRRNIWSNKYTNFRQKLMSMQQAKSKPLKWSSNSLDKARQRKLLNQTMRLMSNHMYSTNLSPSISLETQKASLFSFNQKHGTDNFANPRKILRKEEKIHRKEVTKLKFRTQIQKKKVHSSGILESSSGHPILRCNIQGMSMSEIFQKEQRINSGTKDILNADNFRTQIFKIHLKSQTREDQNKEREKIPFYQSQLKKMIKCLDVILRSFDCRLADIEKQCRSFKPQQINQRSSFKFRKSVDRCEYYYYVGQGNNNCLIKSIFKKRGWWVETDSIDRAHVVWTQLKVKRVLHKIQKHDSKDADRCLLAENRRDEYDQNRLEPLKSGECSKLFHLNQILDISGTNQNSNRLQSIQQPQIIHNHYQCNNMLGDKKHLFFNLKAYYQYSNKQIQSIIPPTYYLSYKDLMGLSQLQAAFNQNTTVAWIVKPAQNSNRGRKIFLTTHLEEIKTKLAQEKQLIVQQYLKSIFLYDGRKFDIRAYLLVVTINGRLKGFFFEEGYLRTSSYLFTTLNIKDRYVHLTNDAVQQTSDLYGKYEEGNKVSYSQFQRYLTNKYPKHSYDISKLHQQMKVLCRQAMMACYPRLDPNRKKFGFELFGLDFMVTSQFQPILIEINTNPCLEVPSHNLERLIPQMLQNMFRLSIDPLFRPSVASATKVESYYLYDLGFLQKNKFSLIFDEKYDRDPRWQQYLLAKRVDDQEQDGNCQAQQEEYQGDDCCELVPIKKENIVLQDR